LLMITAICPKRQCSADHCLLSKLKFADVKQPFHKVR
jgi:hypothetical protein